MHSAETNRSMKNRPNISVVEPRFDSTKLATSALCGALPVVLSVLLLTLLLLVAARPVLAQSEAALYNFTSLGDGSDPSASLTSDGKGNFYGTASSGGIVDDHAAYGTVFEISPNGSGGWKETTLHTFTGGTDGGYPNSSNVIFDGKGNLYGTAYVGGTNGYGVVFKLTPAGANSKETVLYNFAGGADGAYPSSGVIMDTVGNLYGTAYEGGTNGSGGVFKLSRTGGDWTEQVIYEVGSLSAGLTMDTEGNIFGASDQSTVFELSPNGDGGWDATVIYTFPFKNPNYSSFGTPALDGAGNLYCTAGNKDGAGDVYKLTRGKKKWTSQLLQSFHYGPWAGVVLDAAGNIYGTTYEGGAYSLGTVFELVPPASSGKYSEKVLWSFNGNDGSRPRSSMIRDSAGNLYGTAWGGSTGNGVVFEVAP